MTKTNLLAHRNKPQPTDSRAVGLWRALRLPALLMVFFCLAAASAQVATRPGAPPSPSPSPSPKNADAIPPNIRKFGVVPGPLKGALGDEATIAVPKGFAYAGKKVTKKLLESGGNPTNGHEVAIVAPDSFNWFVVFQFDKCGYVKDDQKNSLDPTKLLAAIRKGNERANELRHKRGIPELHITGWELKPTYNPRTSNLEWAIRGESTGEKVVNYNIRLLGRRGVMSANLVAKPEEMKAALGQFRQLLAQFKYDPGNSYSAYVKGDKIAKFGLAALIAGGGLAVAAKTGLLRPLLRLIWLPFIIIAGFFKKLFGGGGDRRAGRERR